MVRKRWALPPLLLLLPCLTVLVFLSPALTVQPGSRRTASAARPCAGSCGGSVRDACFGASGVGLTHSLIVVVRDRSDALLRVLPSWLRVGRLEELVIVDWGSRPTVASVLRQHGVADARLRQAAAPLESEWNLARAYNLAAQLARGEVLLKVDSDTWLHEGFLRQHALPPRTFYAGDWKRAPDENAWHLNGVVLLRREDYAAVAGYDERIRYYGHDDTDLYSRLQQELGLRRACLDYAMISHVGADHASRGNITWAHEFFHKRATQQVWLPWHRSGLLPSSWAVMPPANTTAAAAASDAADATAAATDATATATDAAATADDDDGTCRVACERRPPFFEELADAAPQRAEWRHALSGAVQKYTNGSITARVAQRAHVSDLETLATVYEQVRRRGRMRDRGLGPCRAAHLSPRSASAHGRWRRAARPISRWRCAARSRSVCSPRAQRRPRRRRGGGGCY